MTALANPGSAAVRRAPPAEMVREPSLVLTFLLGGELFAITIRTIKEIIEYRRPTEVPSMPAAVLGVINLRGSVVPVMDLQARLGRTPASVGRRTCIVIVEIADGEQAQTVGIVVDSVSEVLEIPPEDVEPPPSFGARVAAEFIAGMGKVRGRFVILLDVARVLAVGVPAEALA
ncbi:chemotaxis protein CheW [Rubrivivax gelatinosus]|uniref:chemotaxis protein CheW n=1 Tax=Rubrivivax gelatinosus TaxID=28068 RepID=UPI0002D723B8|nr:chemotaxis protein CheW [Rubrivivax gelatinosus]MBG6079013.1 purine-binding chemotaxis protein CheW [Rubrivivax gelatinosus]